ncbi:MAG TPA: universal stress protein [Bdellovibrionota bacterium]|nr:universal stress protein [Bdellovibrionota bacterium]
MKNRSILWAINPYQNDPKLWKRAKDLATLTSRKMHLRLQPAYVTDRGLLPPMKAFDTQEIQKLIRKSERRLIRKLKPMPQRTLSPPTVFFSRDYDNKSESELLVRYAQKLGSPLMIGTTNARQGFERFMQGSFAESLVSQAKVPVILANAKCKPIKAIRNITFATDFSKLSRRALKKLCELAKATGATVRIVFALPDPYSWSDPSAPLMPIAAEYFQGMDFKKEKRKFLAAGARLIHFAKTQGVKATFELMERSAGAVYRSVLEKSLADRADLIAVAARSTPSDSSLFGSTAQDIIRHSQVPVWVYHGGDRQAG